MVIIGIDLGTTNTCFGYIQNGHLKLIDNEEGNFQTPSVVTFTDENEILVGTPALMSAHEYTNEYLYEIKRLIGQSMTNPKVQEDLKRLTYKVEDDFESPKIIIKNATWDLSLYPEEISGRIINKILEIAEVRLEEPIEEAVITVPAYFGDDQRTATKNAASLAGLKKVHIINEPTAAALAFQHSKNMDTDRNILVYDFGGGTFDVSIVQTQGYHCKVLAIDGDCHLGGTDIDMNLVDFMLKDILERPAYGEDITRGEKNRVRRLKTIAEQTKRTLSSRYKFSVDIPRVTENFDYDLNITRDKFEEINQEIFEKTLKIVKRCLKMSGLKKDQIDEVVLVGGSTRIPKVRNMLQGYFGADKVNISRNPDEMVAYGAAVYAESLSSNKKKTFTIQDVLSQSLGTDVINEETEMLMSIIIKRNTQIPCERSKRYVTVHDNQTEMDIKIYQGEESDANKNTLLGDFAIANLKRAPKGKVLIEIKLSVDAEGILSITAKELNTDNEETLNIDLKNQRRRKNKTDIFNKTVRDQGQSKLQKK